jgi:hypothetical protein
VTTPERDTRQLRHWRTCEDCGGLLVYDKAAVDLLASPCASSDNHAQMADAAEMLWVVLANVSGGDWTQQSAEWQDAAARWRDNYFAALKGYLQARDGDQS